MDRKQRLTNAERNRALMGAAERQELIDRCAVLLGREGQDGPPVMTTKFSPKMSRYRLATLSTDIMIKQDMDRGSITLQAQLPRNRAGKRWCMIFSTPANAGSPVALKESMALWGNIAAGRDVLERLRLHMVMDDLASV